VKRVIPKSDFARFCLGHLALSADAVLSSLEKIGASRPDLLAATSAAATRLRAEAGPA
jgi:hypothetical protein